jgi:hypothetical protein
MHTETRICHPGGDIDRIFALASAAEDRLPG